MFVYPRPDVFECLSKRMILSIAGRDFSVHVSLFGGKKWLVGCGTAGRRTTRDFAIKRLGRPRKEGAAAYGVDCLCVQRHLVYNISVISYVDACHAHFHYPVAMEFFLVLLRSVLG